ncbi:MAG: RidA family protein [Actinomycetia bacterium]|nr:RidA family protein [Actinomycetes bacterium]
MTKALSWDERAEAAGLVIPPPLPAHPMFPGVAIDGLTAYTSGIVAVEGPPWKLAFAGSVGDELDVETAKQSAALAMLCTLANLKGALGGSLDRVERFVKLMGFVRCKPEFKDPPLVMNGASEVLLSIFGAELLPARSAIGVAALPSGASVELDAIVKLRS